MAAVGAGSGVYRLAVCGLHYPHGRSAGDAARRRATPGHCLNLAGSGYALFNPPEWFEKWRPQAALLSVAAGNYDGRPDPDVIEALQGCPLLRTDRNGWVELSTDGERLWQEVERR